MTSELGDWLSDLKKQLAGVSETPALDAQTLASFVLKKPRSWVLAHPETRLDSHQLATLTRAIQQLQAGVPLPYVLGRQEFFGLAFEVNPAVLIPRPETELLVEHAITWLQANPSRRRAADIGTGSGCIAVTLATRVPDVVITATDVSLPALRTARMNALRHAVAARVHFIQAALLSGLHAPFDLVCANLPYIPSRKLSHLRVVRHEPRLALDGGIDGLTHIRALLEDAPRWLAPGGLLLLEIESGQGMTAPALAHQYLPQSRTRVLLDLAGLPRLLVIQS